MSASKDFILNQIKVDQVNIDSANSNHVLSIAGDIEEFIFKVGNHKTEISKVETVEAALEIIKSTEDLDKVVSLIPTLSIDTSRTVSEDTTLVIKASIGVTENGAIWVNENEVPSRLELFSAQRLVVLLHSESILSNMHEAYKKIHHNALGFGVFVFSPSANNDDVNSLILSKSPTKSMRVFLID